MPITTSEVTRAAKSSLDMFMKNNPIDQIATERVFMNWLNRHKSPYPGGKQFITWQLRKSYDSAGQWFYGADQVSYNERDSLAQAQFPKRNLHDGYAITEDRLEENGITISDEKPKQATRHEAVALTNILKEQNDILLLGIQEKFDQDLLRDGTADTDAPAGLDHLVSLTPSVGTVGGIDASLAANSWWRNNVSTGLTSNSTGNITDEMEKMWRDASRHNGRPNFILAGEAFYDALSSYLKNHASTQVNFSGVTERVMEAGVKEIAFHGVPIKQHLGFPDLDAKDSPATPWTKRCYFLNSRHLQLKPIENQDFQTRRPPRIYDRYVSYVGITWKGALCINRRNAHSVMSIA